MVRKELLQLRDRVLGIVEDAGGQRRVGAAGGEHVEKVLERAGAARRDDRDRHRIGHRGGQLAVEAFAGAVAVDRRQQDLAGAARSASRAHSTASRSAAVLPLRE